MAKLNALIVGGGAREHALYWAIQKSPLVNRVLVDPGNGGISSANRRKVSEINFLGSPSISEVVKKDKVDLVVVGPEKPLVYGINDVFAEHGIPVFGPTAGAAMLEGSKAYLKNICELTNIPTPPFRITRSYSQARDIINEWYDRRLVIKASGLCDGKGVLLPRTTEEALVAARLMLENRVFGEAGHTIVIEHFLKGRECSFTAICDGENAVILPTARDHKRLRDGDKGPNTGGMGAYAPVPDVNSVLQEQILKEFVLPILQYTKGLRMPFRGVMYLGMMLTREGPYLLEVNVRFGDPEAQVLLPLLKTDVVELMLASLEDGGLAGVKPELHPGAAAGIVLASEGYPEDPQVGRPIIGLESRSPGTLIFHGGTEWKNGGLRSSGGRIATIVGIGDTVPMAASRALERIEKVDVQGGLYRTDIGKNV